MPTTIMDLLANGATDRKRATKGAVERAPSIDPEELESVVETFWEVVHAFLTQIEVPKDLATEYNRRLLAFSSTLQ
jgi:hypothetical protein